MIDRHLIPVLLKDLAAVPALVLYGPRQAGKTTLAKQLADSDEQSYQYFDMELPSDRVKFTDPELFLSAFEAKTVVIDEVQFLPELFPVLRSLIDKNRRPGRFLLLGSASPEILQQSAESLAGRVRYREVFPLSLNETGASGLNTLWLRGGFPQAFLAADDEEAMDWHTDFVRTYATRDMALLGLPMPPSQIERLLQMLAHMHGQLVNFSNLSRSLGVSQPTITNAMYYLEQAMLIRLLKPWHTNAGKRLIKAPKVYIRDSGMLHNLLALGSYSQLMGHPQAGNSWEGFVIQQILASLPRTIQPWFYRSQAGAEIDLLLVKANQVIAAVEIKLTGNPQINRGNTEAILDLQPVYQLVITPQPGIYPLKDRWVVYGLEDFFNEMKNIL